MNTTEALNNALEFVEELDRELTLSSNLELKRGRLEQDLTKALAAHQAQVKVKRTLFSFSCEQDWINKAQSRYANCGVPKGRYITIDANGHVMHMGKCFMEATKANAYPVTCYEPQTNWQE